MNACGAARGSVHDAHMKRICLSLLLVVLCVAAAPQSDNDKYLAALREQIKGHEQEPAPQVFHNIQTPFIKSITAERLLLVMERAYSRSLGTGCDHCHTPGKWESDDKQAKRIAREMSKMTVKLNTEILGNIAELSDRQPRVTCYTCHRGQVKPALE